MCDLNTPEPQTLPTPTPISTHLLLGVNTLVQLARSNNFAARVLGLVSVCKHNQTGVQIRTHFGYLTLEDSGRKLNGNFGANRQGEGLSFALGAFSFAQSAYVWP